MTEGQIRVHAPRRVVLQWVIGAASLVASLEVVSVLQVRERYIITTFAAVVAILVWFRRRFLVQKTWRMPIAIGFVVSVAPVLASPFLGHQDWRLIAVSDMLPTLVGWATLLFLLPLAHEEAGHTELERAPRPILIASLLVATSCMLALARHLAVGDHAYISDEVIFLAQSRWMSFPQVAFPMDADVAQFFRMRKVDYLNGQLYGMYPPGWPALLAVFRMVGLEWWSMVLLGGASVWLVWSLGRRLHGERAGTIAAIFLATSQVFMVTHAGYMSYATGMAFFLAGALCLLLGIEREGWQRYAAWIAAGTLLGFVVTVRYLTGLTIGLAIGLWMLHRAWQRSPRLSLVMAACVALGGLIPLYFFIQYNLAVFGKPIATGHSMMNPGGFALGFGIRGTWVLDESLVRVSAGVPFEPVDGLRHLVRRLVGMNTGYIPIGMLVPITVTAVAAGVRIGWSRVLLFAIHPAALFFYWGITQAQYVELLPFLVLGAGFMLAATWKRWPRLAMALFSIVVVSHGLVAAPWPRRGLSLHRPWTQSDYASLGDVRRMRFRSADSLATAHGNVLLFSREATRFDNQMNILYHYNSPRFDGRIVVARDLGPRNVELMRLYPGYVPYLVEERPAPLPSVYTRLSRPEDATLVAPAVP